ncbi:hypothetical protein J6590_036787 [Homalodisca vitripennis]|nr:hypothetical protein J6590_036787 [Homalodisca vitripennis]
MYSAVGLQMTVRNSKVMTALALSDDRASDDGRFTGQGRPRELGFLTLLSLYILDVTMYCRFKCELVQGRDVHQFETRGRNNFRTKQHRTSMFEHLPSQMGVKLINTLPGDLKRINELQQFKSRLRHFLLSKAFYSVADQLQRLPFGRRLEATWNWPRCNLWMVGLTGWGQWRSIAGVTLPATATVLPVVVHDACGFTGFLHVLTCMQLPHSYQPPALFLIVWPHGINIRYWFWLYSIASKTFVMRDSRLDGELSKDVLKIKSLLEIRFKNIKNRNIFAAQILETQILQQSQVVIGDLHCMTNNRSEPMRKKRQLCNIMPHSIRILEKRISNHLMPFRCYEPRIDSYHELHFTVSSNIKGDHRIIHHSGISTEPDSQKNYIYSKATQPNLLSAVAADSLHSRAGHCGLKAHARRSSTHSKSAHPKFALSQWLQTRSIQGQDIANQAHSEIRPTQKQFNLTCCPQWMQTRLKQEIVEWLHRTRLSEVGSTPKQYNLTCCLQWLQTRSTKGQGRCSLRAQARDRRVATQNQTHGCTLVPVKDEDVAVCGRTQEIAVRHTDNDTPRDLRLALPE